MYNMIKIIVVPKQEKKDYTSLKMALGYIVAFFVGCAAVIAVCALATIM